MNISDEELMVDYRDKSSSKAFQTLFERYEKALFRFLTYKAPWLSKDTHEDLFQKTWLKIHEKRSSFKEEHKFSSWAYAIALNNLRDHIGQASVKHELSLDDFSRFATDHFDLDSKIDAKNDLSKLALASGELSETQQEVLRLIEIDDLSIATVADQLSISQESVRQHLSRARKKIRQLMDKGDKE